MNRRLVVVAFLTLMAFLPLSSGLAVEGDIIFKRKDAEGGTPPAVFPHWFHRIRYKCYACHPSITEMKAGASNITMEAIQAGKFCGACHNNDIAWSTENCDLCHSGKPGLPGGIYGGHETSGPGRW